MIKVEVICSKLGQEWQIYFDWLPRVGDILDLEKGTRPVKQQFVVERVHHSMGWGMARIFVKALRGIRT